MSIAIAGAILMTVEVWGLIRESRSPLRRLPPEKRHGILLRAAAIYVVVLVEVAVVLIAPFGVRKTLTYFVILPFVTLAPTAIIAVGIRGSADSGNGARHLPDTTRLVHTCRLAMGTDGPRRSGVSDPAPRCTP